MKTMSSSLRRTAAYSAVALAVFSAVWFAAWMYCGVLRSRLEESAAAWEEEARGLSAGEDVLEAVLRAGDGLLHSNSTRREVESLWGAGAPAEPLQPAEGAALLAFVEVNRGRLGALRAVLAGESAGAAGGKGGLSQRDIDLAAWCWRLLGTAALLGTGDAQRSLDDLFRAFRLYRLLSRSSSLDARLLSLALLPDTFRLAQRVLLSLPSLLPDGAAERLAALVEEAREDAGERSRGARSLLRARYARDVLEKATGTGRLFPWRELAVLWGAFSGEAQDALAEAEAELEDGFREEEGYLACLQAGLGEALAPGKATEEELEALGVERDTDAEGRRVLRRRDGVVYWVLPEGAE